MPMFFYIFSFVGLGPMKRVIIPSYVFQIHQMDRKLPGLANLER